MTRRILLHIGSPKCGSTFLQRCLQQSAEALAEHGIAYPHPGTGHPGNAAKLAEIDAPGLDALFPPGIHTCVLSHEDLLFLPKRGTALAELAPKAGIDIHVLALLRPFSEILYGSYSQNLKQHFETFLSARCAYKGQSFEAFCTARARQFTPAKGLSGWIARFGKANLTLASHRDLQATITHLLPREAAITWRLPHHMANPSLRVADCTALAAAIADPNQTPEDLRATFKAIHHLTRDPDPGRTPERTAWLETLMLEANRDIHALTGYDNRADPGRPWPET